MFSWVDFFFGLVSLIQLVTFHDLRSQGVHQTEGGTCTSSVAGVR
jgi:hypothetical protein